MQRDWDIFVGSGDVWGLQMNHSVIQHKQAVRVSVVLKRCSMNEGWMISCDGDSVPNLLNWMRDAGEVIQPSCLCDRSMSFFNWWYSSFESYFRYHGRRYHGRRCVWRLSWRMKRGTLAVPLPVKIFHKWSVYRGRMVWKAAPFSVFNLPDPSCYPNFVVNNCGDIRKIYWSAGLQFVTMVLVKLLKIVEPGVVDLQFYDHYIGENGCVEELVKLVCGVGSLIEYFSFLSSILLFYYQFSSLLSSTSLLHGNWLLFSGWCAPWVLHGFAEGWMYALGKFLSCNGGKMQMRRLVYTKHFCSDVAWEVLSTEW